MTERRRGRTTGLREPIACVRRLIEVTLHRLVFVLIPVAMVLACSCGGEPVPDPAGEPSDAPASTTTAAPTHASGSELDDPWPLAGSWAIEASPGSPAMFVVFTEVIDGRAVSIGQAECFVAGGLVDVATEIEPDGLLRNATVDDAGLEETPVTCDPGPVEPALAGTIACFATGCTTEPAPDLDRLTLLDASGAVVVTLVRSEIPLP